MSPRVVRAKFNMERSDGRDCPAKMKQKEPLTVQGARGSMAALLRLGSGP